MPNEPYSYIEQAAVKIGEDILEVGLWGNYFLNGIATAAMPNKIDDFTVTNPTVTEREHVYWIDLVESGSLKIRSFKDMLSVMLYDGKEVDLGTSLGLMGDFNRGDKLGRDGKTTFNLKPVEFGKEWQVTDQDPKLFQVNRAPQFPMQCNMPDTSKANKRRRLGESLTRAVAEKVCAHWALDQKDLCVYDVMATGDLEYAQAGGY